ncbi:MAG TPA: hypothetical protein VMA75_02385 [Candidatus Paceibacterota bacterium]|nr:hypothetical protein [Candidatus Paceibacterota bacterium]
MNKVATITRMAALFIFPLVVFVAAFVAVPAPQVRAYAVGPLPSSTTNNYSPTNSLENLFAPFTNFVQNLAGSSHTTINVGGGSASYPTVNLAPDLTHGAQNFLSQWLGEFDNWVYAKTGVHLSGIFVVLLNAISWTLGLAQEVVRWLLGLFH